MLILMLLLFILPYDRRRRPGSISTSLGWLIGGPSDALIRLRADGHRASGMSDSTSRTAVELRATRPTSRRWSLDLDGYEGPIDVLLALAREQKVDLAKISILALADQYLAFIAEQRRLRLEIAADYLVMAAWLAYLKSRLLLPEPPAEDDGPSAAELAAALATGCSCSRRCSGPAPP